MIDIGSAPRQLQRGSWMHEFVFDLRHIRNDDCAHDRTRQFQRRDDLFASACRQSALRSGELGSKKSHFPLLTRYMSIHPSLS